MEAYRNPSISIRELREMTDIVNEYKLFADFRKIDIKKTFEKKSMIILLLPSTYTKVKKGRSIDSIVFHITKKRRADDNSYKLEDKVYQEDKARKAETEDMLTVQALKSPYTKLLMEHFLLSYLDLTDTKILSGLQAHVYPLYDELKDLRGLNGVKDHLSYVRAKREDYSKKNITKYLKKAIEQYLPTVKGRTYDE
ncbi:hypothetical protein [Lactococcus cremoris]|uniref:hypothetical protein n=1 Tax=Lactococcus lactis subsp. cremoris TaxID=1359 RepID=UPI0039F239F0